MAKNTVVYSGMYLGALLVSVKDGSVELVRAGNKYRKKRAQRGRG
ncbi:MAG: hypothetical protein R3E95_01730 [Thiolinea sp.]